ncbi:MAG: hypothetical protein FJ224_03090 [Lentisphaerae bacterium]|nr:hypothetical protein [Lentisphaerota bacterium]
MGQQTVALADIGGAFWLLIIVVSIVAQIVKAVRLAAKQQGPRPEGESFPERPSPQVGEPVEPSEEIREFLRRLSGEPPAPASPPPPRPPPPQQVVVKVRPMPARPKTPAPSPVVHQPVPLVSLAAPPPPEPPVFIAKAASAKPRRRVSAAALALAADLNTPSTARRAILMREVLGPALALRPMRLPRI